MLFREAHKPRLSVSAFNHTTVCHITFSLLRKEYYILKNESVWCSKLPLYLQVLHDGLYLEL